MYVPSSAKTLRVSFVGMETQNVEIRRGTIKSCPETGYGSFGRGGSHCNGYIAFGENLRLFGYNGEER